MQMGMKGSLRFMAADLENRHREHLCGYLGGDKVPVEMRLVSNPEAALRYFTGVCYSIALM